ncbi:MULTISPECIES: MIP/aquaporin family protein [unclassified Streptomyces]|uniref:MIP/aquaporin family protein n=1 Tax=unclassified Streptomyces TaxID=2593676 RepID=UPI000DBAC785|nr:MULTISPECIES: MIP/aquaporin family protein [unclassified Streptomyces]MYT69233.1 MIP family channel protein [Streptomyces sp. SID8367]RAJ79619.1 glycerol uptake facilitator protein [Streptomyces sp. PsTaAH-137]
MHSNGDIFVGEVIGTAILILFGAGVCAAVTLKHSKARASGWIVIAFGWGFGVLAGAYTAAPLSGGHLNPAVTLGIAIDTGDWDQVWVYLCGQMVGAMLGAVLAYLVYLAQFNANTGSAAEGAPADDGPLPTLGIFSTIPEIRNPAANLLTEVIATIALVLPILAFGLTKGLGESGTTVLIVSLLVVGIGLSLGGPTGYAINPARDLGPRIVHQLLPIPNKGTSDWGYALVPVVGPLIGGALAGVIYNAAF